MSKSRFRNTVLGIGVTSAALAQGYFGVQYNGRNNLSFVTTDDEAIAPTTNHCNRLTPGRISIRKNDLYKRILAL